MATEELFANSGPRSDESEWLINYISEDPMQIGKVRAYRRKPANARLLITQKPCTENVSPAKFASQPQIDVFIMPADMIPELPEAVRRQDPMPVLAYGHALLLKRAFDAGAYDYLKEPWTADEFWARVSRLIAGWEKCCHWGRFELKGNRLCMHAPAGSVAHAPSDAKAAPTVQSAAPGGTGTSAIAGEIQLSQQEAAILKVLLKNRGEAVSRQMLFYALWGKQPRVRSRVVDMHVSAIRKKIADLREFHEDRAQIHTIRGVGYLIPK